MVKNTLDKSVQILVDTKAHAHLHRSELASQVCCVMVLQQCDTLELGAIVQCASLCCPVQLLEYHHVLTSHESITSGFEQLDRAQTHAEFADCGFRQHSHFRHQAV